MTFILFSHPDCEAHDPGPGHAESPARLQTVMDGITGSRLSAKIKFCQAPLATTEQLLLAHSQIMIDQLISATPDKGYTSLDADTTLSPRSWQAALRASGAACKAIDDLVSGHASTVFCATRPPGHHATPDTAMGFCLVNHVAIAALYAQKKYNLSRIAVVDFDVHHGNGSQDILQGKEGILYISTHQSPLYPGSGSIEENRPGNIVNVPFPSATDGSLYREVFSKTVLPCLDDFRPELILVSAGFDAHKDDPLASMALCEEDYHWLGETLKASANTHAEGKLVAVLEGGYNLDALGSSVIAFMEGLHEAEKQSPKQKS